jgi:anti-sigma factor RsiW
MTGSDFFGAGGHPGDHLGDLLSAMADGELTAADRRAAEAHLATCWQCRTEHEGVIRAQQLVAGLPLLEPPAAVWALMRARSLRRWPIAWAGVAAAAAAMFGLAAVPNHHRVTPPLTTYVQVHAASASQEPVSGLAPVAVPVSLAP